MAETENQVELDLDDAQETEVEIMELHVDEEIMEIQVEEEIKIEQQLVQQVVQQLL